MGLFSQFNESQKRLGDLAPSLPVIKCRFCGGRDLRVCGTDARTYLGCPACSADGPMAAGIQGAVDAYLGVPKWLARFRSG